MSKSSFENAFLNGVCRHERTNISWIEVSEFLNGVCRHEHDLPASRCKSLFLNGVCRHERSKA
ncbi:hypothetical protein URS_2219 [Acinetobacter ursingii]|nr:hypothetical protein URS_2219 [Acinetobacter ursingii]